METQKIFRGRLIDHIQLVVSDLARASSASTDAVLEVLGIPLGGERHELLLGRRAVRLQRRSRSRRRGKPTGRSHLAFQAKDRATVERFHSAALAAGGKDNGAPGERPYHPGYYAAFVLDPDGNNIEVVFHGPGRKSAEAIEIEF